jgi:hypothetical protein
MKWKNFGTYLFVFLIFINPAHCGRGFEGYYTPPRSIENLKVFYKKNRSFSWSHQETKEIDTFRLKNAQVVIAN